MPGCKSKRTSWASRWPARASPRRAPILAGLGAGVFASTEEAVSALVQVERVFTPDAARHRQYEERFALYGQLYPFSWALRDAAPASVP